ncbi:MAG: hypothetical protein GY861_28690 [bacterium]|nr:hypothetical protein [bacterium]
MNINDVEQALATLYNQQLKDAAENLRILMRLKEAYVDDLPEEISDWGIVVGLIQVEIRDFSHLAIARKVLRTVYGTWTDYLDTIRQYTKSWCEATYRTKANGSRIVVNFAEADTPEELLKGGGCGWVETPNPPSTDVSFVCNLQE